MQNINESSPILDNQESYTLHSIVTKLLWVKKRGIPDIEPAISFRFTRVTKSAVEEKSKLKRMLKFQKQTINDNMVMGSDNFSQFCTWFNYPYGLHPDLKIHTRDGKPFG